MNAGTQLESTQDPAAVAAFVATLDPATAEDSRVLIALMRRLSGHEPRLWNLGTLGFGMYRYKYDTGREGDCHVLGFHPRKGKTTIYLMDGTARHAERLSRLGRHTATRVCVYVRRLSDLQLNVLEEILLESQAYLKVHDGQMHRV
ncbi:MAG: DUF1801 domain-containing protein [Deltaproteobacteria bacterium]|nr:DUF1801 domain-containing protein [Deltaproteobacteria bacterium]